VRVVVAHCASHGDDRDEQGRRRPSFELFAGMLDRNLPGLYGDISAVTQFNRADILEILLSRPDWHGRLLNGSDYPLPGILPLISLDGLIKRKLLAAESRPFLTQLREHNPLLFDLAVKRLLRRDGAGFATTVFETRKFFDRNAS
jgi:mannonate dehydratase